MKFSQSGKISRTLKVSLSAVAKTIKPFDEAGSQDRHRKGRLRVTSTGEDKFIRVKTASEIAAQINASQSSSNRQISTSTVQRRLRESGLHGRIAAKKPLLKNTNKKRRRVGEQMISACVVPTMKPEGGVVKVWGFFAGNTLCDLFRIQGTLNQYGYHSILQRYAIPSGLRLVGL